MKHTKEIKQLIICHLIVEFFRESAFPELGDILPEMIDSVHDLEEKLEEFSELIEKKAMETTEKEAEELTNG